MDYHVKISSVYDTIKDYSYHQAQLQNTFLSSTFYIKVSDICCHGNMKLGLTGPSDYDEQINGSPIQKGVMFLKMLTSIRALMAPRSPIKALH